MATLKLDKKSVQVPDGAPIKEYCRELNVPFGCENGLCGTCEIEVIEGYDNLEPLNEKEQEMRLPKPYRLACQCVIRSGDVKIKY